MNLADLLPTSTIWTGENKAPSPLFPPLSPPLIHCVTNGHSPFRLNLHVRDNGHGLMFGPTRRVNQPILVLLHCTGAVIRCTYFSFDKGMSMYPTCKGQVAHHFTIVPKTQISLCSLAISGNKSDRAWAMEWIDTILALNGFNTTPLNAMKLAMPLLTCIKAIQNVI